MKWFIKKLLLVVISDFKLEYKKRYNKTLDDSMRPDIYWFEKYLKDEL